MNWKQITVFKISELPFRCSNIFSNLLWLKCCKSSMYMDGTTATALQPHKNSQPHVWHETRAVAVVKTTNINIVQQTLLVDQSDAPALACLPRDFVYKTRT